MAEYAVQHDAHPTFAGFFTEQLEILFRAEHGVDAFVIPGIVAVIGKCFKHRVKIEGAHRQALQVIQLFDHAADAAAEKIVVDDFTVLVGRKNRGVLPVFMDHALAAPALAGRHRSPGKTVGENVIGNAFAEPTRNLVAAVVYGQLERAVQHAVWDTFAAVAAADAPFSGF